MAEALTTDCAAVSGAMAYLQNEVKSFHININYVFNCTFLTYLNLDKRAFDTTRGTVTRAVCVSE